MESVLRFTLVSWVVGWMRRIPRNIRVRRGRSVSRTLELSHSELTYFTMIKGITWEV